MPASPADSAAVTVAYVFLDFGEGGAQRLALESWARLDRDRFRPALVCARGRGSLMPAARAAGIPLRSLGRMERGWDLGAVPALARAFRELDASIVHVALYSRVAPYARLAAHLAGLPLIVCHEHSRPAPASALRAAVDRLLLRLRPATRFLAVSAPDREQLQAAGVPSENIEILGNAVDTRRFAPGDRAAARHALGLPLDREILLVPARLHPQKRHVDLLAALAILDAERRPLVLLAGDGPLRRPLEALARNAGLDSQLRFLGHREDLPELYAAADLVILPSRVEGSPLALLEAQACGRAVLASDVGGVAEIIEDGDTGRLLPPGRPELLAAALSALLDDGPARGAMEVRARQRALAHFDIGAQVRQLESCYNGWLAEAGSTPVGGGTNSVLGRPAAAELRAGEGTERR
jgi:glycosyltransferase involved in cell wall biosynthesis